MNHVKKTLLWAIVAGMFYLLLSHHFIIVGSSMRMLKKSSLTLNYTIFNTKGKTSRSILSIDDLREDGIGWILVEEGKMTEEALERLMDLFEEKS